MSARTEPYRSLREDKQVLASTSAFFAEITPSCQGQPPATLSDSVKSCSRASRIIAEASWRAWLSPMTATFRPLPPR